MLTPISGPGAAFHMSDRALTLETNANLIGWMSSFSQWTQNHVI